MGADLYIEPLFKTNKERWSQKFDDAVRERDAAQGKPAKDAAQEKVSEYYDKMYERGYFRDSYNATSLFWTMGLSWWEDVTPHVNTKGYLDRKAIEWLLAEVEKRKIVVTLEHLKEHHVTVDDGENTVFAWKQMFEEKRERLIAFLKEALAGGWSIRASL